MGPRESERHNTRWYLLNLNQALLADDGRARLHEIDCIEIERDSDEYVKLKKIRPACRIEEAICTLPKTGVRAVVILIGEDLNEVLEKAERLTRYWKEINGFEPVGWNVKCCEHCLRDEEPCQYLLE